MSFSVVRVDDEPNSPNLTEFILDSSSDVSGLPTNVADGSVAYTSNLSKVYLFKNGSWVEAG